MQIDRATNKQKNTENAANQRKSRREKPINKLADDASLSTNESSQPIKVEAAKDGDGQSKSLNNFRETIKDVLEEITSLEVNTMIVGRIPMVSFEAQDFYQALVDNVMYKTAEGLQNVKDSLLERSTKLKQKGFGLPQQTSTPLLPKEAAIIEAYRVELNRYNQDLEDYQEAERIFSERRNSLDANQKLQFDLEESCYMELSSKLKRLDIKKDANGDPIIDGKVIRSLRKLWEFEQSVLNGDRIYAQTKFHLDGDLNNRFIDDLFIPSKSKIDPKMSQLVFDLHRQGVENAQKQWSGLIDTCVNIIKNLMPFRSK